MIVSYVYNLKSLIRVIDGDTIDIDLDLGFSLTLRQRVRLYGINAPEIRATDSQEKAKGIQATAFVMEWFNKPGKILVQTYKEEKYGRMLANCIRADELSLCDALLQAGLALPYLP